MISWEPKLFVFVLNGLILLVFWICVPCYKSVVFFYHSCQSVCEAALSFLCCLLWTQGQVFNPPEWGCTVECQWGTCGIMFKEALTLRVVQVLDWHLWTSASLNLAPCLPHSSPSSQARWGPGWALLWVKHLALSVHRAWGTGDKFILHFGDPSKLAGQQLLSGQVRLLDSWILSRGGGTR